jgi:hypothetical protein
MPSEKELSSLTVRVYLAAFVVLLACISVLSMAIAYNSFLMTREATAIRLIMNEYEAVQ